MSVLVIRTTEMDRVTEFLTSMGLSFEKEKHGSGPVHYALEINGKVLEIYPSNKTDRVQFID